MLHLPTIISLSFILNLVIALFFISLYRYKKQSAFLLFGFACLSFSAAELVFSLRLFINFPLLTHYIADILIILSPLFIIIGLHKYRNTEPLNLFPLYCVLGFYALMLLVIYPYDAARMLTSLIIALLFCYNAYIVKSMTFVAKLQQNALISCFVIHAIIMFIQVAVLIPSTLSDSVLSISRAASQIILISHLVLTTCSALILPFLLFSNNEFTLSSLANTDQLSELLNRRGFFSKSKEALNHSHNVNKDVSIVMLDIDLFKHVNDEYGHETGDKVIKWIALHIKEQFSDTGICARIGGEEFAILLPGHTLNNATSKAEKLRENICNRPFFYQGKRIKLSLSAGVSHAINNKINIKYLLSLADKHLYLAKQNGRDNVVTYDEKIS